MIEDLKNKMTVPSRSLLSEDIYKTIKSSILNGTIIQGERLVEMEIAKQFHTSQTPVREAFKQLQQDRLLKSVTFKGKFVESVTDEEIPEIYQLRTVLEIIALKWFFLKMNEDNIKELKLIIKDMKNASLHNDIPLLVEKDISFHRYICIVADSKNLYPMWSLIDGKSRLIIAKLDTIYDKRKNIVEITKLHQQILEALVKKDIVLAIEIYGIHTKYVLKNIIKDDTINASLRQVLGEYIRE